MINGIHCERVLDNNHQSNNDGQPPELTANTQKKQSIRRRNSQPSKMNNQPSKMNSQPSKTNNNSPNKHPTSANPIYTPKSLPRPAPVSLHPPKRPYRTHDSCSDGSAPPAASTPHRRAPRPLAHPRSTRIYPGPPWPAATRTPRGTARCA